MFDFVKPIARRLAGAALGCMHGAMKPSGNDITLAIKGLALGVSKTKAATTRLVWATFVSSKSA